MNKIYVLEYGQRNGEEFYGACGVFSSKEELKCGAVWLVENEQSEFSDVAFHASVMVVNEPEQKNDFWTFVVENGEVFEAKYTTTLGWVRK